VTNIDFYKQRRWFAVIDDCVGGYSITMVDKPTSVLNWVKNPEEIEIGNFLSKELATYIVHLHNSTLPKGSI
jgi:hypothetical protein